MEIYLFKITILFYFISTGVYIFYLIVQKENTGILARNILFLTFLIHTLTLILRFFKLGTIPVTNLHESFSFLAWAVLGVYLFFSIRYRIPVIGSFVSPVGTILVLSAAVFPHNIIPITDTLKSIWLPVHVSLIFLGEAIFTIAFCVAIMYLIQERQLKRKKVGAIYRRLPSLDVLDELNYRCLTTGFPLLTLGIISGSIWASYAWGSYWNWDPKETWAIMTWFLYAAQLHGRLTVGWRGKRAAILAIIGFTVLIFSFVGVNLFFSELHRFA